VDISVIFNQRQYLIETMTQGQRTITENLERLAGYLNTNGEREGWLVIFDKDRSKSWDEKIGWKTEIYKGFTIHIVSI
jgi:hypothetical protein